MNNNEEISFPLFLSASPNIYHHHFHPFSSSSTTTTSSSASSTTFAASSSFLPYKDSLACIHEEQKLIEREFLKRSIQKITLVFMAAEPKSDSTANLRITVERNPSESRLSELGIKSWPKWGCSPGKYQLKFEERETCYLVKGKVRAYPRGGASAAAVVAASSSSDGGYVEFGAGDLVIIPKGLSCTWDVSLPVDKYYKFDASSPSSSPPPPFC